jgi:peptidoglycan/LPS O-acetylase OafA/YrhL
MKPTGTNPEKRHWLDAWHVNPSTNRDYDFIDGLRGVAILMVVLSHDFYTIPNPARASISSAASLARSRTA